MHLADSNQCLSRDAASCCPRMRLPRQMPPIVRFKLLRELRRLQPPPARTESMQAQVAGLLTLMVANLEEQVSGREAPDYFEYSTLDAALLPFPSAPLASPRDVKGFENYVEVVAIVYVEVGACAALMPRRLCDLSPGRASPSSPHRHRAS